MRVVIEELTKQESAPTQPVRAVQQPMPASVTLVHDDPTFLWQAAAALSEAGHEVDVFADPISALNEIEVATVTIFITRVTFFPGKPNGVSMASLLLTKYPGMKVIFVDQSGWKAHTVGIGEFIPQPFDVTKMVEIVNRISS